MRPVLLALVLLCGCVYTQPEMQLERDRVQRLQAALHLLEQRFAECQQARQDATTCGTPDPDNQLAP